MTQKRRVIYMTDQQWEALQIEAQAQHRTASAIIRGAIAPLLFPTVTISLASAANVRRINKGQ